MGWVVRGGCVVVLALCGGCLRDGLPMGPDGTGTASPTGSSSPTPMPAPDDFGDESDGDLTVPNGSFVVINDCFGVARVDGGDLLVNANVGQLSGEPTGRRLLVLQTQDGVGASGDPAPIAPISTAGGTWEVIELASIVAEGGGVTRVIATGALEGSYESADAAGRSAQVCTVPEYRNVEVQSGGVLTAAGYDGEHGGVLAFYARQTVLQAGGIISVSGAGFRGGEPRGDDGATSVTANDTPSIGGLGGGKGEGLSGFSFDMSGRGNLATGGGGGNAHNSGGGGGGLGGVGGDGGMEDSNIGGSPNTWGFPGVSITQDVADLRLWLGGGGGAGQQNNGVAGSGGAGGGVVWVRTETLGGDGMFTADGADGADAGNAGPFPDGAGGAGSGGTIWITVDTSAFVGTVSAAGGDGGNLMYLDGDIFMGPGGGGGGGVVVSTGWNASPAVSGGTNGLMTSQTMTIPHGAGPGAVGVFIQN